MGERPVLHDPRWRHHTDHPTGDPRFVDQEFRIEDDDGQVHVHVERTVNRRARTDRPPTGGGPS